MFGLLNVNKPAGLTSRDVVNRVERLVRPLKVGHAGTLDPLATGVLVLGLGQATRLVEYVQRMPKTYGGTFLLGRTSDTDDVEGHVTDLADARRPTLDELQAVLSRFLGRIEQQPPAFSALKVQGQRAYRLARRGQSVELAPRTIEIHRLEIVAYEYPSLKLLIDCGGGTYVRSLGRDLARAVGTDAVMSSLCREAIGPFLAGDAIAVDRLDLEGVQSHLLTPMSALADMPRLVLTEDEARRLHFGQTIADRWRLGDTEAAAVDSPGQLVAIVAGGQSSQLRICKGFAAP